MIQIRNKVFFLAMSQRVGKGINHKINLGSERIILVRLTS